MLQKELVKRLKARYDTKMDGNEWLEVSSDGIPLCRIKYNGQFLSNADQNLSDEYRSKIADIQDEISTVREYVGLYEHAPQMKAADVSDYRQLAAFGDTVLAATYNEKNGFMFCTWKQNADGNAVFWGDYSPNYRRCTWTAKGKRKIVWRCINRLDYGKKYCHHSPSIEESLLQDAVMRAIMQTAKQNVEVLKTLKIHIGMGLTDEVTEDKTLDIQIQIAEIDAEFQKMLKAVSADNADGIDEERITELMNEKQRLTVQLEQYATMRQKRESAKSRLDEIFTILDGLQNHPMEYDDKLVRQIIECVVVESKEKIKVVFIGGTEIEMTL